MKKRRISKGSSSSSISSSSRENVHAGADMPQYMSEVQRTLKSEDAGALAAHILWLSGSRGGADRLTKSDSSLWMQASRLVARAAHEGVIVNTTNHDTKYRDMGSFFGNNNCLPVECVASIATYLEIGDKIQLATLNKAWRKFSDAHYFWESLDPFPVPSFASSNEIKTYFSRNGQRFIGCRQLQMPRIPTSFKLFQDIFATMPLLNAISLHNVAGCMSLRHCVSQCPDPRCMLELSVGLSTRVSPAEIAFALKSFGKQAKQNK
jgi:hypothetical protein